MEAIGLSQIESASLRSLLGFRSTSKAGFAVNATTNTYTLTIGTKQTDDIITVDVLTEAGLVTAELTVLVGHANEAAVATALELLIEALAGVNASAVGAIITIVPATTTQGIVVTSEVTKAVGDPTTTAVVAQTIIGSKGIKTANVLDFVLKGHCGQKAATNNIALTGAVLPAESYRWYLISIDENGNFTATPSADNTAILADIPVNQTPCGALKIATAAATTFTPGITSLNATGITDTYYDLSCVPKAGIPS